MGFNSGFKGLEQALCAPYSDAKSWELWSFTGVPDGRQTQAPNIIWVKTKVSPN